MKMIKGIPVFGEPQWNAVEQMQNLIVPTADKVALMADNHLGYSMPIGGVAAYKNHISPSGVGYDIACGNKAVCLDADASVVRRDIRKIMDEVWSTISFGMGRKNEERVDHSIFNVDEYENEWDIVSDISKAIGKGQTGLADMAKKQLGTVGGGNHYIDIFVDATNRVWIGCHFGSRGLGHKIATYFVKEGGGKDGINSPPVLLAMNSQIGQDYELAMKLAGDYAYAGRDWVCERVAKIIGANIVDSVHNHHNFSWKEEHGGETYNVVRKGATPAFPGQRGFIGGSMAECAVIVKGIDSEVSKTALYSTVHGAGRILSRSEAKGKTDRKTGEVKREGKVTHEMMREWVNGSGVELRGGDVDESPHCYKRLSDVLEYHLATIEVENVLVPIGVAMAGNEDFDPYKG